MDKARSLISILPQVKFQPVVEQSDTTRSILSATSNGFLLSISMGGGNLTGQSAFSKNDTNGTEKLVSAEHGLTSLSFDPLMGKEYICCCCSESLVYVYEN